MLTSEYYIHYCWFFQKKRSKWAEDPFDSNFHKYDPDSIDAYLTDPIVSTNELQQAGGVLLYWEKALQTRPCLARMALDFLSAPGELWDPC
jgi:hypothetical protein